MRKTALIAGPYGIVGNALLNHLAQDDNWDVVTVSRRAGDAPAGVRHVTLDLLDVQQTESVLAQHPEITHIFYCAYAPRTTPMDEVEPNLAMLVNLVLAVQKHARNLDRVVLMHGTKWYGNHLGPFRTPAREDDARHLPPNFYYNQQDWITEQQRGQHWSWTAFRPHGIFGYALGSPMNHLMALSLYATAYKEVGDVLKFPGLPGAFQALNQYTDAGLLARAAVWSTDVQACENQAFNINNGEPERWSNVWAAVAHTFRMQPGDVQHVRLEDFMPANEASWKAICERHGLTYHRLSEYVNWSFADWVYANSFDQISSLHKIRKAGWGEVVSFEEMLRPLVSDLRRKRILPNVS